MLKGGRTVIGLLHPLDLVRRRMAKGLQVEAGQQAVQRGGEVEALVTISSSRRPGSLEVGLVCTEFYDEMVSTSTGNDGASTTERETSEAIAHQDWQPVESATGVQKGSLRIPPEAPFSYSGSCLSFKWEVVARARRSRRLDAQVKRVT